MKKQIVDKVWLFLLLAVLLAACGGNAGKLMGKGLPDETQVIDGPSLALPPQYELRPPREAADYESVLREQKRIEFQGMVTGTSATAPMDAAAVVDSVVSGTVVPATDAWILDKVSHQTGVLPDPNVRDDLKELLPEEEAAKSKKGLFGSWFGSNDDE